MNSSIRMPPFRARASSPALIAVGMALLIVAMFWPKLPTVTAVALVALGATNLTLARFRHTPAIAPILLLHATTYGALYAIFVGAALHAATTTPGASLGLLTVLDLAASMLPAAATLRVVTVGIGSQLISER